MHLRLVSAPAAETQAPATLRHSMMAPRGSTLADYPFDDTPLVVVFAATDDLSDVREGQRLALASAADISPDDAYLVLPLRAREGLVTAFARGAEGRVTRWIEEAIVVRAELDGGRAPRLWVGAAWRAMEVIEQRDGSSVSLKGVGDAMRVVNQLDHVAGVAPGGMLDRRGLEAITTRATYVGVSRMGIEELGLGADAVEPTFVWTSRNENRARVHIALSASEDDSIVALLAPVTLVCG